MKKVFSAVVVLVLTLAMTVTAFAAQQDYTDVDKDVSDDWYVRFIDPSQRELDSNFKNNVLSDSAAGMQPGDSITFKIKLTNQYKETTDWWMTNEVIDSLETSRENRRSSGGGYSYILTYQGPGAPDGEELYNSDKVGGDIGSSLKNRVQRRGLQEATEGLENFFYLDTLKQNEVGYITLSVTLDGETQGNDYQDTLAKLKMNFAVELTKTSTPPGTPTTPPRRNTVVKTGDDRNMVPYFIGMGASGALILILAIVLLKRRKNEEGEDAA